MSADNEITEYQRTKLAVWDYPVIDRFTKMIARWGGDYYGNISHAIESVQMSYNESVGWAWFGDASDIKYQDLLHCDIRTVDVGTEQGARPYAFALPKDSPLKEMMNYE